MKKVIIVLAIILISSSAFSQKGIKHAPYSVFVEDESQDTFLISTKPITNREYIIYLAWLHHVYIDYPEVFLYSLPMESSLDENKIFVDYSYLNPFKDLVENGPEFFKNYMFNPTYIDYPVIGLNWLQASKYCKWATDRYNEYKLIKENLLKENQDQINEDCFVSEAYLQWQYGIGENRAYWSDHLLIPNFRLPTTWEIEIAEQNINKDFKPYIFDTNSYLQVWHKWFLEVSENKIKILYPWEESFYEINHNSYKIYFDFSKFSELTLNNGVSNNPTSIKDIFIQNRSNEIVYQNNIFSEDSLGIIKINDTVFDYVLEKDSLGMMNFLIIEENKKGVPIMVEKYSNKLTESFDPNKLYIFRYACSIRPKQFKY
jgi:hypothetical protein